ncbi:MAG: glycosyltransferase family 4 protein [Proteobacteria bacterium]|nr:glycosyltransferase family 4 protein [Pseudomonadota bacterium]
MKILQLFSDWKWTGPAEPTVSLCEALTGEGVDVTLAYRCAPLDFQERTVEKQAKDRGIKTFDEFRLNRYFSPEDWLYDIRAIKSYVAKNRIDIIHTNLSHDHFTAIFALLFSKNGPLIIRTDHKRDGMPFNRFMSWAVGRTDGLVSYSSSIMKQDMEAFRFPQESTCVIPPGVRPYNGSVRDMRDEFGIKSDEKVVGIIGRLKPDRGYGVILEAFRLLRNRMDKIKLLIMGRSSQIEQSIKQPIVKLGLKDDVILAGYWIEDYFSVISTFDLFVMMRAGSDGTARALREVMAMGKPAIVSDMGMLPELVEDGESGYVVRLDEHELAAKMEAILTDEERRNAFGIKAKQIAVEKWNFTAQAQEMKAFYEKLLVLKKKG